MKQILIIVCVMRKANTLRQLREILILAYGIKKHLDETRVGPFYTV